MHSNQIDFIFLHSKHRKLNGVQKNYNQNEDRSPMIWLVSFSTFILYAAAISASL